MSDSMRQWGGGISSGSSALGQGSSAAPPQASTITDILTVVTAELELLDQHVEFLERRFELPNPSGQNTSVERAEVPSVPELTRRIQGRVFNLQARLAAVAQRV